MTKHPVFDKSFASSDKAVYWSNKNDKKPHEVSLASNKKYWFDCNICNHSFDVALHNVKKGHWCSYCSIQAIKLCKDTECNFCLNKSFASSDKAVYWSNKNDKSPREVNKVSSKKYLFNCINCSHIFNKSLAHIKDGSWCPFCSNQRLCNNSDCIGCFDKSFAGSDNVQFWSHKNILKPREVFLQTGKKHWFDCKICYNSFYSVGSSVTKGTWCPVCKNKTESKLFEFLKTIYPVVIHQKKFDWCMHTRYLPFDFYIPSKNLIIELDGPQHFIQVSNWDSPFKIQIKDAYKERMARQNGYTVIRVLQEDVLYDKNNWQIKIIK